MAELVQTIKIQSSFNFSLKCSSIEERDIVAQNLKKKGFKQAGLFDRDDKDFSAISSYPTSNTVEFLIEFFSSDLKRLKRAIEIAKKTLKDYGTTVTYKRIEI